jgi:hypothetical protein
LVVYRIRGKEDRIFIRIKLKTKTVIVAGRSAVLVARKKDKGGSEKAVLVSGKMP